MKIIVLVICLISLISLHVFADTYAVVLDSEQDEALMNCSEDVNMLPDEFVQDMVAGYVDGIIDDDIQQEFKALSKKERRTIARRYIKKNKRNKQIEGRRKSR